MKKDILICILLGIISLFTLKDLYKPGFYTSHDGPNQIVRMYYFDQAIHDGQIPPRWSNGLLSGFGYPLFNFSYHMPWYIAEAFNLLGFSTIDSIKYTFLFGYLGSGIAMYVFLRSLYPKFPSFIAAFIYIYAPYRFANIFVRAAIGDATILFFAPLLFLSIVRLLQSKTSTYKYIALGGISLAGLLLSHAMVFTFFFGVFIFYCCYIFVLTRKMTILKYFAAIFALGIGLSSYYVIPSTIEREMTRFSQTFTNAFNGATSVALKDLIYSPWGYAPIVKGNVDGMSFQVGLAQWLIFGLGIIWISSNILKKQNLFTQSKREIVFFICVFILSIIAMLDIANPLWKITSNLIVVDFSWRILGLTVFSISVVCAGILSFTRYSKVIGIGILIFALYANRNYLRINQSLDWSVDFHRSLVDTTNQYDEYLPRWVPIEKVQTPKKRVEFLSGGGKYKNVHVKSNTLSFNIEASPTSKIRINTIYYPGWVVDVNGKRVDIDESAGFIDIQIPKGKSNIYARFTETPMRIASNIGTIIAIIVTVFLLTKPQKNKKIKK